MLLGTTGVIRSGKTALDTTLGLLEAEDSIHILPKQDSDFEIFSNFHIDHPKIKFLPTPDEFTQLEMDEMNGLCILQETQVWFESRGSTYNEVNKMVDKTVLQSGKLGFDILWDAQLSSSVDKRLRFMTLNWFATRRKIRKPELVLRYIYLNELSQVFKFHFYGRDLEKLVFPKYNTRERTDLIRKVKQQGRPEGAELKTTPLLQPNGDEIDALTPEIPDKKLDVNEFIKNGITEIIS